MSDSKIDRESKTLTLKKLGDPYSIGEYLIKYLSKSGKFFRNGDEYYYLDTNFSINTMNKLSKIFYCHNFFIRSKDIKDITDSIISILENHSVIHIDIKEVCYYDSDLNIFYIYNFDKKMYKVTKDSVSLIDNDGSLGFIFKEIDCSKFTYIEESIKITDLPIFNLLNCESVFKVLFINLGTAYLLRDVIGTLPLAVCSGEATSGKTTASRMLGKIIFGDKFDVSAISKNRQEFLIRLSARSLLVIDNMEKSVDWLDDALCSVSTGGNFEVKKMYTDDTFLTYNLKALCFITSINVPFDRHDVLSRSIVFKFNKSKSFLNDITIFKEIENSRNLTLSFFINQIKDFISNVSKYQDSSSNIRLSGFIGMMRAIYPKSDAAELENVIIFSQRDRGVNNSIIMSAINNYLMENDVLNGNSHDIFSKVSELRETFRSPQQFAKEFKKIINEINFYFSVETKNFSRTTCYTIKMKEF